MQTILDERQMLLDQLQKVDPSLPFSPMVKRIKPYKDFVSRVKHSEVDLALVDPSKLKFWSDTHFFHHNIIKYCERPFHDIGHMTDVMVKNYMAHVHADDVVVWVGDVCMRSKTRIDSILETLPGYKILIMGNHDFDHHHKTPILYDFDEVHLIKTFKNFIIAHHPWWDVPTGWVQIHGHIHNKTTKNSQHINVSVEQQDYKPISLAELLKLSTYPSS
jgi:calcineurin-like phosphoesterase family protein